MKCPVCKDTNLVMTERQGVEIDYCPQCRGVWLDRGELDKIIERSLGSVGQQTSNQRYRENEHESFHSDKHDRYRDHGRDHHEEHRDSEYSNSGKKKSFLTDFFDF
ncbi:zf-TFIIB domain-containing protein [uncultured Tolumonas sp.]|uniref:TFIIB-type zinc ribbon-containing protein n=1 Tax=uncultured Tolumonas sp. TaxID=263765 RepID=UPI0029310784|nr:zf-TFIIB domain-containing protein [uncultured Tolumonas sp.]